MSRLFLPHRYSRAVWALCIMLIFLGCQRQPASPATGPQPDPVKVARLAELQQQRDTLASRFTLKAQNLALPSYYHATWGAYALDHEGLLAGVDSNGVVFLIHCYDCSLPAGKKYDPHNIDLSRELRCSDHPSDLLLELAGARHLLPSHPQIEAITWGLDGSIHRDPSLTDTLFCTDYFILSDTSTVPQLLREQDLQSLRYGRQCDGRDQSPLRGLDAADQAALRDCARLGAVLQEQHRLRRDTR